MLWVSNNYYKKGESVIMNSCELHSVFVEKGHKCVWKITESPNSCDYNSINYSKKDLTNWTSEGLYVEVGDDVKEEYLKNILT
jgi:hypothetical protein